LQTTENLSLHQEGNDDVISFIKKGFLTKFPDIKTIPTTENEIESIIHFLKRKNS
jgi:hypothetical protein